MTIKNRKLNEQLGNLESCAQQAPVRTYETAKNAKRTLDDIMDSIEQAFRRNGFEHDSCDMTRDLHAYLYGYMKECNPELADEFAVSEGFGEAVDGPQGKRIIGQAEQNRDFIEKHIKKAAGE